MTSPGWYNDEQDVGLARWHDGSGWTAHTLVIADWTGADSPPPPVGDVLTALHDPMDWSVADTAALPSEAGWDEELWGDEESWSQDEAGPPRHSAGRPVGPDWRRLAAPAGVLGVLLLAVLALNLVKDDDGGTKDLDAQETSTFGDIDDALTAARRGLALDIGVTDADLKTLIRGLCDAADSNSTDAVAQDAARSVSSVDQLQPVLAGAARGAATYCPAATSVGGMVDDVAAAAALELGVFETTTLPDSAVVDPAAPTPGSSSSKAGSTTQPTTKSSGSGVTRTESRSQSSTGNDSAGNNDTTSGDVEETGNIGNNNQTVNTVVTAPPTTADTTPAETTDTTG